MASTRPPSSISLPSSPDFTAEPHMPRTPEAQVHEKQLGHEPPPPPRPQPFKVRRKRPSAPFQYPTMLDTTVIPTIEMSEVPSDEMSSPTLQPTSAHLLSPVPMSTNFSSRGITPPRTPAPKTGGPLFSQLESPEDEWHLIKNTKPMFQRASSMCSSFSDSSVSSCGSSAFSLPTGSFDSPQSEATDPFLDEDLMKQQDNRMQSPVPQTDSPQTKRIKTRRGVKWTPQMDDHLWMTFMAYLSDPTLTPFKMLPGSTPPMGVCDQVAGKAKRTWRARKAPGQADRSGSIDAIMFDGRQLREATPDNVRLTLTSGPGRWPKVAATRRRLRELCAKRPSISAHYARMLRTRSPSPFETSSPASQPSAPLSSLGYDMHKSLVASTAPSMQPDGMLAQLANDGPPPPPKRTARPARPDGWFDRIPRSKAHQKSASLQSELKIHVQDMVTKFDAPSSTEHGTPRTHLLHSFPNTKSLGRTEFNGRSLDSPFDFKVGAPTDRRSRKRRFRSDEEKPRRPVLSEDIFGPPVEQPTNVGRNRGFSLGAVRATDNLTKLFTPPTIAQDLEMPDVFSSAVGAPFNSRSAPRRLLEPVPRLGSPFIETPPPSRQQRNTFPRNTLLPHPDEQQPFQQRLLELAGEHARTSSLQT